MHQTAPVCMLLSRTHLEPIQVLRLPSPYLQMILGYPWLSCENPKSDWATGAIGEWGTSWHRVSLVLPSNCPYVYQSVCIQTSLGFPKEYQHLWVDVGKAKATNCHCIDSTAVWLTSCLTHHHVRVLCTLHLPLGEQLWKHTLSPWLQASFIPCPLLLGLAFFVVRKDKSMKPCMNWYPPPLISLVFELFQGATIFIKLDLHNTYYLVHIRDVDVWKTTFNNPIRH